jgi:hypothetical protein
MSMNDARWRRVIRDGKLRSEVAVRLSDVKRKSNHGAQGKGKGKGRMEVGTWDELVSRYVVIGRDGVR